jgi:hypothetical protein
MIDQHIYDALDALEVSVKYVDLPDDRDGEYIHRRRLIRLQRGMASRLHRSVLAHETAHAVFADVPSKFGPVNWKQERRADEWAALRLIDIDDYKRAEATHHGHAEAIAVELNVTIDLVDAFRRVLVRFGDTVYVGARMGAGMWLHREQVV